MKVFAIIGVLVLSSVTLNVIDTMMGIQFGGQVSTIARVAHNCMWMALGGIILKIIKR